MKADEIVTSEAVQELAERVQGAEANWAESTAALNESRAELDKADSVRQSLRERASLLAGRRQTAQEDIHTAMVSGADNVSELAHQVLMLGNEATLAAASFERYSVYELNTARRAVAVGELDEAKAGKALAQIRADHHRATVLEKMRPVIELEGSIELNGLGAVSHELDIAVERHRQLVKGLQQTLAALDESIRAEREEFDRRKK